MGNEKLLNVEDAAKALLVKPTTVREWLKAGKLKGVKMGRLWRVRETDLETFIKEIHPMAGKPLASAKLQQLLDGLIEVRNSASWPLFQQFLPVLLHGAPEQIQALRNGDLAALEKASAPAENAA